MAGHGMGNNCVPGGMETDSESEYDWGGEGDERDPEEEDDFRPIRGIVEPPVKFTYYELPTELNGHVRVYKIVADVQAYFDSLVAEQVKCGERLIVGLDCEWHRDSKTVGIMQFARHDKVALIDVKVLRHSPNASWEYMILNTFQNENILKVTFGIGSDIAQLERTCESWKDIKYNFNSVLDLAPLSQELAQLDKEFYPFGKDDGSLGGRLYDLVQAATGKILVKTMQMSDWNKRPLDYQQTNYAAADAYSLVDIFSFMAARCKERGIDFKPLIRKHLYRPPVQKKVTVTYSDGKSFQKPANWN